VINAHLIGKNDTLELVEAAIYSPERVQAYTMLPNLQFPDQSNHSFPDSWEIDADCPYLSKDIRDFPQGQQLAIGLCFSYVLLVALLACVGGRRLWTARVPELTEKSTFTSQDGYFMLSFLVEFLQILELGPTIGFPHNVRNTVNILSLNLWEVVQFSKGVFWGVEGTILAVIVLYISLCGVRLSKLDSRLSHWAVCRGLSSWIDVLSPPLSSLCFLSIVSTVMTVFVCDRATGPAFTASFLAVDCWERCWSGTHLRLALVSAMLLCLYVPLAVFTRPLWQQCQSRLHIKANPRTFLAKSALQLVLIAAYVTLPPNYPALHAGLYLSANAAYTVFSLTVKPYNYERINLWERLTLLLVLIYSVLGVLKQANCTDVWLILAFLLAVLILCALGLALEVLVPRYRSLLVRQRDDRYDIIQFAFTFGRIAQLHLQAFRAKHRSTHEAMNSRAFESVQQTIRRVPLPNFS